MPAGAFVFRAPPLSPCSISIRTGRSSDAMASSEDKSITCVDCGEEFLFTAGEQAFYRERGLTNEPTRCKNCREKRKAGRGGHPGGAGGGGGGGGGDRRPQKRMDPAPCSPCGRPTGAPVMPPAGRPRLCRLGFQTAKAPARRGGGRGSDSH